MAKNYDDYGYEDDERSQRTRTTRKLLIIVLIVIAIFLILYLVKSCSTKTENKPTTPVTPTNPSNNLTPIEIDKPNNVTTNYEELLLVAGKNYFSRNVNEDVKAIGECNIVDLQTLVKENLIDSEKFSNCNLTTTYLRVCVLENNTKQYTPWLSCMSRNSDSEYNSLVEGSTSNVIANSTYTEFKFSPLYLKKGGENLGSVQEIWKDEINYSQYKTLKTIDYYRYRDNMFIWELQNKYYYSTEGDKNNSNQVLEYYISSPKTGYTNSSDRNTGYKWYQSKSEKQYYTVNGEKALSLTAVGDYTYKDPVGVDVTRYRTRTVTSSYSPYLYNICSTNASNTRVVYQYTPCGQGSNPSYTYKRGEVYSCANPTAMNESIIGNIVERGTTCKKYSSWSSPTTTRCDTSKPDVCESATVTFYYWYKPSNEIRTYYPSSSNTASGERVYYTSAPFNGAIKDESTKATVYKWYKEVSQRSSNYSAVAPSGYTNATRTNDSRWGEWSGWSTTNPKVSDGRQRQIEQRTKIRLQEIKPSTADEWVKLSDNYLTEQELIKLYNDKGYNVKTLSDISNNGELKYNVKMYIRNKKENR